MLIIFIKAALSIPLKGRKRPQQAHILIYFVLGIYINHYHQNSDWKIMIKGGDCLLFLETIQLSYLKFSMNTYISIHITYYVLRVYCLYTFSLSSSLQLKQFCLCLNKSYNVTECTKIRKYCHSGKLLQGLK